jgi:hypothetical protein
VFSLLPVSSHDARPSDTWHLVEAGSRRRRRSVDGRSVGEAGDVGGGACGLGLERAAEAPVDPVAVVGLAEPAHRDDGAVDGDDAVHDAATALLDDVRRRAEQLLQIHPESVIHGHEHLAPCTSLLRRSSLLLGVTGAFSFTAAADKSFSSSPPIAVYRLRHCHCSATPVTMPATTMATRILLRGREATLFLSSVGEEARQEWVKIFWEA